VRDICANQGASRGSEVTENDLVNASVGGIPLSRAMKDQINHIRQWAFQRAVRASPGPVAR
jgi:hypothetical protein